MNFNQGVDSMIKMAKENPAAKKYQNVFEPYPNIIIRWPGKRQFSHNTYGDYQMRLIDNKGQEVNPPSHQEVAFELYCMVLNKEYTSGELIDFLEDVYFEGTNCDFNDEKLDDLKHIIYWITMQEQINFPRGKGIKLPFSRYYEAILSADEDFELNIKEVQNRCDNFNKGVPQLIRVKNPPAFYC